MSGFQESTLIRSQAINDKIYSRSIPSAELKPSFDMRPVSTKYTTLPIVDSFVPPTEQLSTYAEYSTDLVFNPGNDKSPWKGFSNNVNVESQLRNQFFALQKADQAEYVPNSDSDLYNVNVVGQNIEQKHPMLFNEQVFNQFNPNILNLGKDNFNNYTRIQLKNLR